MTYTYVLHADPNKDISNIMIISIKEQSDKHFIALVPV